MPRVRTRGGDVKIVPYAVSYQSNCPGSALVTSFSEAAVHSDSESIVDSPGLGSGRYPIKACSHSKLSIISQDPLPGFSFSLGNTCPGTNSVAWVRFKIKNGFGPFPGGSGSFSSGLPDWADLQLPRFLEAVPATVSLPNFLLELDEIPKLIPQLQGLLTRLRRYHSVKDVVRAVGNGHLLVQFGILAPIRDISRIIKSYDAAMRRLNWLRRNNHKTVTVRRRREQFYSVPETYVSGSLPYCDAYLHAKRKSYTVKQTDVVGARLSLNYSQLNALGAEISAHRATLGFNKPLSVIWEAVPLSWIVDYFIRVQETLDKYSIPAFEGFSVLSEPWWSQKYETSTIRGVLESAMPSWYVVRGLPHTYISYTASGYNRGVGVPSAISPPSLLAGPLSGQAITNLAAYLASKGLK